MAAKPLPVRPLIGINTDFYSATKQYTAHARLNSGYFDSIVLAEGIPMLIPPLGKGTEIDTLLDRVDGVLLTGGLDLDPRRYGQPRGNLLQPMSERRDASDWYLIQKIIEKKKPCLAIGVGMQQVNVMLGGTLFNHIPLDVPKAMPHLDPTGVAHRHMVNLVEGSLIGRIYETAETMVNSRHHQAINQLGRDLKVGAVCPDGVIEAIESTDPDWFFLGVQWHPEADTASKLDRQIFDQFIRAAAGESWMPLTLPSKSTSTKRGSLAAA